MPQLAGPFERPLRRLYWLAPLLCAALLGGAVAWRQEALFSPGPLSPGHAVIEADCARCHSTSLRRLHLPGAQGAALALNRDCLRCHQRTIGHSERTQTATHHERVPGDGRPCADCHREHQGRALTLVDDRPCLGCHADLRAAQREISVAARIDTFTAAGAASGAGGVHPEFRWHVEKRPDPGTLRFNHRRHLHDQVPGPDGKPVSLRCQDCHRQAGLDLPWRFGKERGERAADDAASVPHGEHMAPISYAAHCAGCHPLPQPTQALRGDDAVPRGEVPHTTPGAIRTYLRGQLAASLRAPVEPARLEAQVRAIERGVYGSEGQGCRRCHQIKEDPRDAGAPPTVVPTALPPRFLPRARFHHARHTAAALGAYKDERLPDCLACHPGAADSTRTADVLIPGIAECRRCHGPATGRGAASRGGAPARCVTCHSYHVPPPQALGPTPMVEGAEGQQKGALLPSMVKAGMRETRHGLRRALPRWPLSAFFELPARVWGLPDIEPGSERFRREVFSRYGLFPADFPNDGLPMGLLRTERTADGEPGLVVTCELCHSSSLFGRIVIGQPNPFVDFERIWNDLDQAGGKTPEAGVYAKTPAGNTVVNGADHLGLLGLFLRNPDLSINSVSMLRVLGGMMEDLRPEFDALAYIKTPSWYTYRTRVAGKSGLYADGGQPKNGNFAAYTYMVSFYDKDGQDLAAALAAWQRSGHAFLSSLEAPRYPFPIRAELLPLGRQVYGELCAACHGTYAPDGGPETLSYPGLVFAASEVGTDPKRSAFPASFVQRTREVLKEEYTITGGYAAPPLSGVWARAPYLHNGSVPTLWELLDPPSRRARYALAADPNDPADYDQVRVGWRCDPLPEDGAAVHRAYDPSRVPGLGNGGHPYGAELDAARRAALIEYLKTL